MRTATPRSRAGATSAMAASSKTSDAKLISLFLDMLAAEQGAGDNTLDAYRRDLDGFLGVPRPAAARALPSVETQALRGLSRRPRRPRLQVVERGAPAVGAAASVSLPAQRADSQRRSGRHPVRPEARPRPAEGAVDIRRRPPAGARQGADARRRKPLRRSGFARCGCIACWRCSTPPACGYPNWCRCRCSAARRDARMIVVRGKGDKERLVPLNEASRQAMADYLAAMEALKAEKKKNAASLEMAVSLVRRERTSDAAAFRPRPEGARGRGRAGAAAGQPACAASRLRQPSAAQRRRPAHRADAARPHRHLDHADLHPCGRGTAEEPGARPASAGGEVSVALCRLDFGAFSPETAVFQPATPRRANRQNGTSICARIAR